jgi:hypothetical protein
MIPKLDVAGDGDGDGDACGDGDGDGEADFSYIWIANSPQGTVSKIDTQTLVEEGRYQVRPQGGGQPSRTSVNLDGDMAIASREGGVTKIWAEADDCMDDNGMQGIQTSTGKNDVLAWDVEECVAWYTDYAFVSERAIAWTSGELDKGSCKHVDAKVWVGATPDSSTIRIMRLNGDDGSLDDQVDINGTTGYMSRSPYGAAVDADNDMWTVNGYCNGSLMEIKYDDMTFEVLPMPGQLCPYGIAVDSDGYVWIGGYQTWSGRYDPDMDKWDYVQAQGLGIQEDQMGRMWLGAYGQNGVYSIDSDSMQILDYYAVPTTGQSKGISIDFYGYVWIVSDAGNRAVRLDPDTDDQEFYDGLDSPYSYSDMTGWGLKNAVVPQ